MKVVVSLLPIAIVVAVIAALTWFLLEDGNDLGSWLLAALLFAHGWVHLMFVFPKPASSEASAGGLAYPFDLGRSWLIGRLRLDPGLVRRAGLVLMVIVFGASMLAALATVGLLVPVEWWAGLVVSAALTSMLLLAVAYSPALLLGFVIDLALLWLVAASLWSPAVT
jgi:hypothetical protein